MFYVWDSGGLSAPYIPGIIRDRRTTKVQPFPPVHKAKPHPDTVPTSSTELKRNVTTRAYEEFTHSSPIREPAILAKQIMTSPVVTLPPMAALSQAWEVIGMKRFRHIPIVSPEGKLIGLLSDRDLLRTTMELTASPNKKKAFTATIQDIMVTQILSASPDEEIRAIVRILFEERIGAMPLVNHQGEIVGILTRSDILRTIMNEAPFEMWQKT